jgi:tRNA modification GTPase
MAGLPDDDTIAAIATATGNAGIGVIRISGPDAFRISHELTGVSPAPRQARLVTVRDHRGEPLDTGLLLHFPAPHSFTGEDVAELHGHGGSVLLRTVLRECLHAGARQAEPGEFSRRAFLNDKIDLLQAEAIADLIASSTETAARSATRSLSGAFSRRVEALLDGLIRLRVFVEAAIDFPEEEVDFIADSDVADRLTRLREQLQELLSAARRGRRLRDGFKLVIAGAPNAGKSSLLNQLAEQDAAIVTDVPGTTRDVLREFIEIDGLPIHIVDTAGLRLATDAVEREGISRAHREMQTADRILLVVDAADSEATRDASSALDRHDDALPPGVPVTLLLNKIDLNGEPPAIEALAGSRVDTRISLSARTGDGLDLLRHHLLESAGVAGGEESDFSARQRHLDALEESDAHLASAAMQLDGSTTAPELLAEDLRYAQESLGRITGRFTSDDLLGEIFGSFCIGK